jgi:hypothetical protein
MVDRLSLSFIDNRRNLGIELMRGKNTNVVNDAIKKPQDTKKSVITSISYHHQCES